MPRAHTCTFCGRDFPQGTGTMYVKTDGTVYWFCSSKCRKSTLVFRRDARKFRWTKPGRAGKGGKT